MSLDQPAAGRALWSIYDSTGIRPEWLIPGLAIESGLNPSLPNAQGYPYYGINQISGNWLSARGISPSDYLTWTASQQLFTIVKPYMEGEVESFGPLTSGIRVYQANFYPASLKYAPGLDDVIVAAPHAAYEANRYLDTTGKGSITPRDLGVRLEQQVAKSFVQRAIADTYTLRPTETPTDPVFGASLLSGSSLKTVGIAAAILGVAGAAAWWISNRGLRMPRGYDFAFGNPARGAAEDSDPSPMYVQSLLFPRSTYNVPMAKSWARSHGYKSGSVDVTAQYIHLVQADPAMFSVIRTIPLGGKGIKAHVARE